MTDIAITARPYTDDPDNYFLYLKSIDFCCETMMKKFFEGEIQITNINRYPILRPKNLPMFKACPFCETKIRVVAKRPDGFRVPLKATLRPTGFRGCKSFSTDSKTVAEIENNPDFDVESYLMDDKE